MIIYLQMIESDEDKSKFEQLYIMYKGLMFHVAMKILKNEFDAEDAVHQAFLSLIENLKKISDVKCPKTRACVSLNEVVLGRYTFVFLNYFTSMVVIIILYLGFVLCRKATFDVPDIMLGLGLSFLVFSTITGIQMPLFFKMGYTKAKLWSVIPFAVVMLLVVLPSFVSALSGILDFAQSHKELFAFACILTSCIIQFVSYHIAVIFYRKQR